MKTLRLFSHSLATLITVLSVPVALEFSLAQPAAAADIQTTRDYFVGKTWKSANGSTYTFLAGGQCVKTTAGRNENFQWRDSGAGVIEARGADVRQARYFRFVTATEAYDGDRDNINQPIALAVPPGLAPGGPLAAAASAPATPPPLGQRAATPSTKDFYLDKTWQTPTGTTFTFLPGGKCLSVFNLKQNERKWRAAGRIVEVSGGTEPGTLYFRFVSPTEAYYGGSKNQIFTPVTAK